MEYKVFKFFSAGSYEKEEKWLNQMSAKGLNLVKTVGFSYTFEDGTPGEYTYRLELLKYVPDHPESAKYMEFLAETGIEYVASYMRWVYLRKKKADGDFELYSDSASKMSHYKRIITLIWIASIVPISQIFTNVTHLIQHFEDSVDRTIYFTFLSMMIATFLILHISIIPIYKAIFKLKKDMIIQE